MNNTDLISVIIPVYNVEQYLNRCVDSVINQTYKNLEIILIDDGSTDNSGKICDEYALKDDRIKIIHKQNVGVSSARNEGLKIAKGDYIGFVDGDDYIEKDMYEVLHNLLVENKIEVSCCDFFVFNKKGNKYISCSDTTVNGVLPINEILNTKSGHGGNLWNKLYSKNLIADIRFNENLSFGEDYIFVMNAFFKAKEIVFCKEAKYYYCYNANSVTRRKSFKKEYLKYIEIYDRLVEYCKENNLQIGYKKYKTRQINWIISFLSWIAQENPIKNKEGLDVLLKYAKKNLGYYLLGNNGIKQKSFLFVSCINFNVASKIYRLMLRQKGTK